MNDPNGFSRYGGKYHLFYQYYPDATCWGPTRWGHAVSGDLIRWERLPDAIMPDRDYDIGGCFSGTAVTCEDGRHMLMYTGCRPDPDDRQGRGLQTQCIAFGNGTSYEKYHGNPVITGDKLPAGGDPHEFRDPKIWQETDGTYRAVIANHNETHGAQILLFRSGDGLQWEFEKVLADGEGKPGWMWECPDFFPLDGRDILMAGTMGEVHTICRIGDYDHETGTFLETAWQSMEQGFDFYAGQTVQAADGRRILIGWMQNPQTAERRGIDLPINGQMSIPRELTLRGGRILQKPVRELEAYRTDEIIYRDAKLRSEEEIRLNGIRGRTIDLELSVRADEAGPYELFRMRFASDGQQYTELRYEPAVSAVALDRSHAGPGAANRTEAKTDVRGRGGRLDVRILLDKLSAEIFINDGEQVMSAVIYTDRHAEDITFYVKGTAIMDIAKYRIKENK
ncbi:MAG: glycoside hydrolase family 32 protein [Firmicutes bacterium]|nr:glycoside hydrolase family 32 protein [Bacillota bacterium]